MFLSDWCYSDLSEMNLELKTASTAKIELFVTLVNDMAENS